MFESLAYVVGFQAYLRLRRRSGDALGDGPRLSVVAAAIVGAAVGSKLLHGVDLLAEGGGAWREGARLLGGKSVVGGLLGGLLAVEGVKRWVGIRRRTGDLFALPLALGIAVGRVGCFLAGLEDGTHGLPTTLPWGVDFGDGVPRHPAQLYEIAWLAAMMPWLAARPAYEGAAFRHFMTGYLAFRLGADFLKPGTAVGGLTAIQWACAAGLTYYLGFFAKREAVANG